ncbi:hypothetical protein ACFQVC_09420 [Streptomyces monticola]|uniref:Uncharacterized protein n=1 Tax=Streptomyces monticola TaxID=2666263 RepID=A0ABW2JFZ1_9ACTN
MSSSPRRACPECTREIAVVAGRLSRHDPPPGTGRAHLVSCPGSKRQVSLDTAQRSLDGHVVPDFPGQMPLF